MNEQFMSQNALKQMEQDVQRRRRTIAASFIVSFSFLTLITIFLPELLNSETPNYWALLIPVSISLIGFVAAWLAWKHQIDTASYLLLGTILVLSLFVPIVAKGMGISVGLLAGVVGIGIAVNTLPARQTSRGTWLSIATGVAVIIIDQIIPDFGFQTNPVYTNVTAAILFTIFLILNARRFQGFPLRTKLVVAFSFVTILPLFILGFYNNFVARQNTTQQSQNKLVELSRLVAQQYDSFINDKLDQIRIDAKQITIVDYLILFESRRSGSPEEAKALQTLITFKRREPVFIDSYAILDFNGKNILSTSNEDINRDESQNTYFKYPIAKDQSYSSDVLFAGDDDKSIYFSTPIKDPGGHIVGVLRVKYNAAILQHLAHEIAPNDPNITISIVDKNTYLQLADSGSVGLLYKSLKKYADLELSALQAEGKMPKGTAQEILSDGNESIVAGIDGINENIFFNSYSSALRSNVINTGVNLSTQPWVVLVSESAASSLQATRAQTRNIVFISLIMGSLAVLLGYGASQLLAAPLISLTQVAERISAGDTTAHAQITTEDEIGALSTAFNKMTDELNRSLSTLEERVAERTTDLESARQQTEKRASELLAIGEIARLISSEQKIETLLPLITRLVSERFGFYHTGIFLLDETRQFAVLQAANSEGGKRMLERGHKLGVGESGIVGYVAKYGNPRIALDVGADSVFFNNPDLPSTRSEMSLPLTVRGQILGVLDIQSEKPGAFTTDDADTLTILADQVAVAIENARLFQQTQQALSETQALYRQNIKEGWAAFSREESLVGYRQTMSGGRWLNQPVEADEIRDALNHGNIIVAQPDKSRAYSFMVVPVKLRGQAIGTLKVQSPVQNRAWTNDEINLAGAVSERLSLALENARLIRESQKQVIKEQAISEVTSKIGASIDLKSVLQTAVEELGRIIPGSEVVLRIQENKNDGNKEI